MPMDRSGITHLTFDCYGTLVDWESGILTQAGLAFGPAQPFDAVAVLKSFVRHEAALEAGNYVSYRRVLAETIRRIARDLEIELGEDAHLRFAAGLGEWPLFSDTRDALRRLASKYRLVVLSNVDDDLFALTAQQLGVSFEAVITAQQVRSYKPATGHFTLARERLGLGPDNWLHVAQSLYHDHAPAKSLSLRSIWVDRPSRLAGTGLAPATDGRYDARTTTLAEVADLLGV